LGDEKFIMGLKTIVNQQIFGVWIGRNLYLRLLLHLLFFMDVKSRVCSISHESWRKTEQIQNNFITYNLKIKGNTPYPNILLETSLSPIEKMDMTRYLMYKKKLNMEEKMLQKIASKSSHNHHQLKQGWHKDAWSWLNYWGIMEDTILQPKDTTKKIVRLKFKEKMWCDKELEEKRKIKAL
jgi:hypothetical protein